MRREWGWLAGAMLLATGTLVGCADKNGTTPTGGDAPPAIKVVKIEPGPDAQTQALEALIGAESGTVIEFAEGKFEFDSTLSLEDVQNITIRGAGMDKTILNFAKMQGGTGGEGLKLSGTKAPDVTPTSQANAPPEVATAPAPEIELPPDDGTRDNFTIEDLTVQDSKSDGIKVEGATGVFFCRVKVEWTRGPHTDNGAYGLYPVLSKDILIDGCIVIGASDAGIYVGQTENVIVRNCRAEQNVAGIEIENTVGADVYQNVSTGNTGGLLVFALPGLPKKSGSNCRVFDNQIYENNLANFAKAGNIVATVPQGTGMIVMANDNVEVFNNTFRNNETFSLTVISYLTVQKAYNDPKYDPYSEGISIHDNSFEGGGDKPAGKDATLIASALDGKVPSITFDGVINAEKAPDGQLPPELRFVIKNNKGGNFANLRDVAAIALGKPLNIEQNAAAYEGELAPLSAIKIEGIE